MNVRQPKYNDTAGKETHNNGQMISDFLRHVRGTNTSTNQRREREGGSEWPERGPDMSMLGASPRNKANESNCLHHVLYSSYSHLFVPVPGLVSK